MLIGAPLCALAFFALFALFFALGDDMGTPGDFSDDVMAIVNSGFIGWTGSDIEGFCVEKG